MENKTNNFDSVSNMADATQTKTAIQGEPIDVKVSELHPFPGHPFQVRQDAAMKALVQDVRENGVIQRVIVRPCMSGGYEIISGHRRTEAARQAGLATIPAELRWDLTGSDAAVTVMLQTNLQQRQKLLPSERAFALRMMRDIVSRQSATALDTSDAPSSMYTKDILANMCGMSPRQVYRYIRLAELNMSLLDLTDAGTLRMSVAVELSYLDEEAQSWIADYYDDNKELPTLAKSKSLHATYDQGTLTEERFDDIMAGLDGNSKEKSDTDAWENDAFFVRLREEYYPGLNREELEKYIIKLVEDQKFRLRGYRQDTARLLIEGQ